MRGVARLQARLQDGDEDGQHAVGELGHELAQRARRRLLQLLLLAGEAGDELPGELGQDDAQRLGCVGHEGLPHEVRRLLDADGRVLARDVQRGEHLVLLPHGDRGERRVLGVVLALGRVRQGHRLLVGEAQHQVAQQLGGRLPDAVVLVA